MPRWFFSLALVAVLSTSAFAQLPPDKALAALKAGDGLQVELFAAEPMLINPTSMDIDHLGRVWVCEAVNYRRKMFNRPLLRPEGDRIVILTDKNGDGKADESTVFYQGSELYGPIGIAVAPIASGVRQPPEKPADAPGSAPRGTNVPRSPCLVFVCQSPDILLFEDKDGDGKADGPPKKFLTGFGGYDHDHGVHGINIGPDGKLYFTVGDGGVKGLQSSDGKGHKWETNHTDCQAGTVWRCDFDGTNLELIAHNFRNNYECCVNSFGEIWLSDNDDDGNQQTRICFVMPGGNYGYWPRGPGQSHWHEEQPGIVHKTLRTGFGSPTGICFYEGTLLPEKYRGQLLHTDAGPRELRCFHIKPKGAGYELTKEDLLTSTDNWFRPSDVCVAPDGSVFVCDWYDPGVGGHGMGDWTRGRVYRVTPKGHKGYKVPAVKLNTKEGVLAALGSPCLAMRAMAQTAIFKQADDEFQAVRAGADRKDDRLAARLLAVSAARAGDVAWLAECSPAKARSDGARSLGVRLVDTFGHKIPPVVWQALIARLKADGHRIDDTPGFSMSLAREALLLLRKVEDPTAVASAFYTLAAHYNGRDHFYRAALNIACGTDPKRRDAILADFDKHFPEWNDTVADLVWELRPKSVLPRLTKLLADGKLTAAQKGRIVDILAVNEDPAAGKALLALLGGDQPAEVKARALENLRLFLPTKWNALAKSDDLHNTIARLLDDPKALGTGLRLVAAARHEPSLEAVAWLAADPKRPLDARRQAVQTLGEFKSQQAIKALDLFTRNEDLRTEAVRALGKVRTEASLTPLKAVVRDDKQPLDLRREAVAALAASPAGTRWLLDEHKAKALPAALVADAGRLLRNSPFQGERNKALQLFPASTKIDLKKLPAISDLAKRKGNADRGKELLAKSLTSEAQCLKCHTVRGTGGQIGPDLSLIGKKGSRENLFESILQPSKAIADQFVTWKVDTEDGQSVVGLLVQETATTITIRDANGKDHQLPAKGAEKKKQPLSLMPEDLAATLTEEELVDLVEYLMTLQGS